MLFSQTVLDGINIVHSLSQSGFHLVTFLKDAIVVSFELTNLLVFA